MQTKRPWPVAVLRREARPGCRDRAARATMLPLALPEPAMQLRKPLRKGPGRLAHLAWLAMVVPPLHAAVIIVPPPPHYLTVHYVLTAGAAHQDRVIQGSMQEWLAAGGP